MYMKHSISWSEMFRQWPASSSCRSLVVFGGDWTAGEGLFFLLRVDPARREVSWNVVRLPALKAEMACCGYEVEDSVDSPHGLIQVAVSTIFIILRFMMREYNVHNDTVLSRWKSMVCAYCRRRGYGDGGEGGILAPGKTRVSRLHAFHVSITCQDHQSLNERQHIHRLWRMCVHLLDMWKR